MILVEAWHGDVIKMCCGIPYTITIIIEFFQIKRTGEIDIRSAMSKRQINVILHGNALKLRRNYKDTICINKPTAIFGLKFG
jgi:hypothetical protein